MVFVFIFIFLIVINNDLKNEILLTNGKQQLSNKKICWGIKRFDNHEPMYASRFLVCLPRNLSNSFSSIYLREIVYYSNYKFTFVLHFYVLWCESIFLLLNFKSYKKSILQEYRIKYRINYRIK